VQQAWLAEQVTMCGYCEPGFIMAIAALLQASPSPSNEQIAALPNICRCGAYPRIRQAIARAAAAAKPVPQPKQSFSGTSSHEEQQGT
jgi:isoquinoline 1-oxidoreductase alpha subunit